ncbi:Cro/CI family transcriptional regulator [Arsenophonus nasoniae]|uniref:Cro/CI family transcriptional regulator n=1 Tax=Arsenophonus nasoniae TaxID=638 RepID=A0AA95GD26_9GAMM|nr:Cro/CI family transcriptional regulator [Arsenophonus nasoniae]WGL96522.1 Cro/CI family transcriptional regulator [Arsenophonus nasoniae]
MNKSDVLAHFKGVTNTAIALGVSKSTVSLWREIIPWQYALLVSELTDQELKFDRKKYPERFITKITKQKYTKTAS